ncbi:MAG TPA: hypothetical protein VEJ18_00900 [Planctomycetota bacterium]|nr:hypothetical protein [Planctomycetota bacterium]
MTTDPEGQPPLPGEQAPPSGAIVPPEQSTLENVNLVPALEKTDEGKDFLKALGKKVCRRKDEDERSSEGYREMMAEGLELFLGRDGKFTSGPAKGSKRPCHPTLAKIHNRIYPRVISVVMQSEPVPVPTGDEDQARAQRVQQHIAWEKRAKHPEWGPTMCDSVSQWIVFGSMFRSVGWDPLEKKKSIEYRSCADLILPYSDKDSTPDLRNVERITEVDRLPRHRIKRLGKLGWFSHMEIFSKEPPDGEQRATEYRPKTDDVIRQVADEFQGQTADTHQKGTKYEIFKQHLWEELPEIPGWNPDKDMPRRICVWVESSTKKVLRLVIMEREIRTDRIRADNEAKLLDIQRKNWEAASQRAMLAGLEPPPPPSLEIEPPAMEPNFTVIHYRFMPNPEGIYGLGCWAFTGGLNKVINDLLGEDILAHRLANMQGGIVSDDVANEKGTFELEYGKFNHMEGVSSQQLKEGIMPLPFERPKGNLAQYIEKLDQEAQAVLSSSDLQSGLPGPSHETAAAAKLRAYQGATAVTAAVEQFLIPLACEYKAYARLNAMFMSDVEYFYVTETDPQTGQKRQVQAEVTRADYETDFDITFEADVRLEVDPGIGQSALEAYMLVLKDPICQSDPNIHLAALKKALRALKAQDLAAKLPDNIPPPTPPSPMSQEEETAGFMNEQDHPVLDDDDHGYHLAKIAEYRAAGMDKELSPTGKQLLDRHERAHKAKAYLQGTLIQRDIAAIDAEDAANGNGQPGTPGVAGRRGNAPPVGPAGDGNQAGQS